MNPEKDMSVDIKRLSSDSEYFSNVFKRTEKIISVIFYILSHTEERSSSQKQIENIKDKALETHEVSLKALRLETHMTVSGLRPLQYCLLELESTLRIAEASALIPSNLAALIYEQVDVVSRYLTNHYLTAGKMLSLDMSTLNTGVPMPSLKRSPTKEAAQSASPTQRKKVVKIPSGDISSDAYLVYSQLTDRAERIKTVLEAKPHATIRDIAEIITDVGEKTIQRELNSLIEKGQVLREGERRWSRYSVSK